MNVSVGPMDRAHVSGMSRWALWTELRSAQIRLHQLTSTQISSDRLRSAQISPDQLGTARISSDQLRSAQVSPNRALWTEPIREECLGGPYGPSPFVMNVLMGPMDRAHL